MKKGKMTTERKEDKKHIFFIAKLRIFQGFQFVEGQSQMSLSGDWVREGSDSHLCVCYC